VRRVGKTWCTKKKTERKIWEKPQGIQTQLNNKNNTITPKVEEEGGRQKTVGVEEGDKELRGGVVGC